MKIYIKNMVCDRCNIVVSSILDKLRLPVVSVKLGEIDFGEFEISKQQRVLLQNEIESVGFALIDDKKNQLIDKIKTVIIKTLHQNDDLPKIVLSDLLKENVNYDYNHMSQIFSNTEGITIEQFYINQKIERVKELLAYGELNNSEIAFKLDYSSPAHLSGQFKKIIGMTPTQYKKLSNINLRKPLDKV